MVWFHAIAERDHEIQNPTSAEKLRLLGERLRLGPESDVLDIASGRGGPALILAETFGCRITCVERAPEFVKVARARIRASGLDDCIEVVEADAASVHLDPERYDAALCLGASFVWDGLAGTLAALSRAVHPDGYVAVGEPYWRSAPAGDDGGYTTLAGTVERLEAGGLRFVSLIAASEDDWDRYESLHWQALEEWLAENPVHPDAERLRTEHLAHRTRYLHGNRSALGWAVFVGWKPPSA
jgi:SAM-dependent methyltransferase